MRLQKVSLGSNSCLGKSVASWQCVVGSVFVFLGEKYDALRAMNVLQINTKHVAFVPPSCSSRGFFFKLANEISPALSGVEVCSVSTHQWHEEAEVSSIKF